MASSARLHVAGWFENQDAGGTLQPLAALVDTALPTVMPVGSTADYIRTDPRLPLLLAVFAAIDPTTQARCRVVAASFRNRYGLTALELPNLSSTNEPASPACFNDLRTAPIRVGGENGRVEDLSVESDNNPAAAADQFVIGIFADKVPAPISLDGFVCVRFTTTAAALTANGWSVRALTPVETLQPGKYAVAGGKGLSTTAIFMALLFPGTDTRAPIGAADTRTDVIHPLLQPGQLGVIGEFDTQNPPVLHALADAADNEVQVVDLWLKRTG